MGILWLVIAFLIGKHIAERISGLSNEQQAVKIIFILIIFVIAIEIPPYLLAAQLAGAIYAKSK